MSRNKKIKYLQKVTESNILLSFGSFRSNIQTTLSKRHLKYPHKKKIGRGDKKQAEFSMKLTEIKNAGLAMMRFGTA